MPTVLVRFEGHDGLSNSKRDGSPKRTLVERQPSDPRNKVCLLYKMAVAPYIMKKSRLNLTDGAC